MSEVTSSELSGYKARRLDGGLKCGRKKAAVSESTVKKELGYLNQVFTTAIELWSDDWNGYFRFYNHNPVKVVMKGMTDVERTISSEEAIALRKTLPAWLKPLVIIDGF